MMNAASAAGQAVATQIGAIANAKRDAANQAAEQAAKDGNSELAAQYAAEAKSWDEGGTYRIALHTAGGALIAGLGGGSVAGGAAGAGVSAALAGDLNRLADQFSNGGGVDPALTAGNIGANLIAGAVGGLIGGNSGAFAAGNADLYNRSSENGEGKGSTKNSVVDKALDWAKDTYSNPIGDVKRWIAQATGLMNADAQAKASQSPTDLMAQGTANGINAVLGSKGGEPPMANPGTALADSTAGAAAGLPAIGKPGYVPSNAILNGGSDGQSRNQAGSPQINPTDVAGKTPQDIAQHATDQGLVPKGPDPMSGKGAYLDPVTGQQRVLIHPDGECPHCHVNDSSGARLDINGNRVPSESPDAHLPLKK
ncbi:hemagglutinin [Caballeronia novacaledonica]|uniref:Hemagglutinin n=1 Tax=Caballeronia novacaledonica TaxID=1544861 RepID=A0A2U3IAC4_9BURK|nr:hypothetical protein [Caballeronia novacaledonica]SPB17148.1 hemagglutinin [Caballeronia novacaledonica]